MATTLKLRTDIKKLKGALSSKGLPASVKAKLKGQLDKAQNELKAMQSGAKPRKVSTTKGTQTALTSLQKMIQKKKFGVYQGKGIDLKKDAEEGALPIGRRISKGIKGNQFGDKKSSKGHVYYEYRANRLDVKQPKKAQKYPKLEDGGMMAHGGMAKYGTMMIDGKEETIFEPIKGYKIYESKERGGEPFVIEILKYPNYAGKGVRYYYDDSRRSEREYSNNLNTIMELMEKDLVRHKGKKITEIKYLADGGMMAKGGMSQGYDDREDERLGIEYGKMSSKDLNSTHARRDDARFEERGKMADGGVTEKEVVESNSEMVLSQIKAVKHHADELSNIVTKKSDIEAWVVAKIERASTDLSDITHYLDGQHEKMSMGGTIHNYVHKMDKK